MRPALLADLLTTELRRRMSYRGDFWISAVSSLLVRLAIAGFIVDAVFAGSAAAGVAGYDRPTLLLYYAAVILIGKLVQSSDLEQSVAQDIYEGGLTRYLMYPVSYGVVKYVQQLGSLGPALVQVALFGVWLPFVLPLPPGLTGSAVAMAAVAVVMANLLQFLITYPIQLVAFWADNVWSLMVMHRFASSLLGGLAVPLAMFPDAARRVLEALPFRYLFAFPVEVLLGRVSVAEWALGLAIAGGWCAVAAMAGRAVWRRGTLQYTGVGI